MSETATCRERLSEYCIGPNGIDVGAGGDPIVPTAICIDRADDHPARGHVGNHVTNLVGDAGDLYWFKDNVFDWVYSSHTLEDTEDTKAWLAEWLRVIKPGGNLILFLPDERAYRRYCDNNESLPNQAHKHANFSLSYVKSKLLELGYVESDVVYQHDLFVFGNPYSFEIVVRKK